MVQPTPLQAFNSIHDRSDGKARPVGHGERMTGAQALVRSLMDLGVTRVFGVPGGQNLALLQALDDLSGPRFTLTRHEQAAGHAAEGYALSTGKVGVCLVASGPAATNMVTPIADAMMDSVPLVVITGQVATSSIGTDAFQEADIVGITYPVVKHSYLVTRADDIPSVMTQAFHIAASGRPGPVVVDVTTSAQEAETRYTRPLKPFLPGYNPVTRAHGRVLTEAAELIAAAHRPLLYVGGGAVRSGAGRQVARLSRVAGAPLVTTLPARGIIPDSDPAYVGMSGIYGSVAANGAIQACDLLVAIGARFDEHVTGDPASFAPGARVVHIDVDPAEIGKNRRADVPIVGDAALVLDDLIPRVEKAKASGGHPDLTSWWRVVEGWKTTYPTTFEEPDDGSLAPQWVIGRISSQAGPDTVWVTDVGQHQMWASQFIDLEAASSWVTSCGLGTSGYGLPAAIGAARGVSDLKDGRSVWLIAGDGGFQMTSEELATARQEGLPLKIAILDNASYGMIDQWDEYMKGRPTSSNAAPGRTTGLEVEAPDFVALAQAYGCMGLRATTREEALQAISQAQATDDRPVLIDFRISPQAAVWPLVPPGGSLDDLIYRPGVLPLARVGLAGGRRLDAGTGSGAESADDAAGPSTPMQDRAKVDASPQAPAQGLSPADGGVAQVRIRRRTGHERKTGDE